MRRHGQAYRACEEESRSPDKGRSAGLTRAAKLIAVLRGIGYSGVHIGGPNLRYEDIEWVIGRSAELSGDWPALASEFDYPQKDGYYLYEKQPSTGLNAGTFSPRPQAPAKTPGYASMRFLHRSAFAEGAPFHEALCSFFRSITATGFEGPITELEYLLKFMSSRCRRCGDCTLAETAFLCPQSQCPKFLLNGQCGGSSEGWCEVFPGRLRCIFVRAYERLRSYGEESSLKGPYVPPRNWALDRTSSWANYFLGLDHRAQTCDRPL